MKTVLEEKMKLLEKAMEQLILNIQSNNSDTSCNSESDNTSTNFNTT